MAEFEPLLHQTQGLSPSAPLQEKMGEATINRDHFNESLSMEGVIVFLVIYLALYEMGMNALILTSLASPSKLPNIMIELNKKRR